MQRMPSRAIGQGQAQARSTDSALSCGMVFLVVYMMVAVGRIQEVVPVLAQVRAGLVFGLLALLVWINMPGSLQDKIPLHVKPVKYVLILLALGIITVPISVWPSNSLEFVTGSFLKTVLLFLLVFTLCRSLQDVRRIVWGSAVALALLVIAGILNGNLGRPEVGPLVQDKYVSQTYDPNDIAFVLVMIMPLLLYLFSTSSVWLKPVVIGLVLISMYGIVQTQSRGGFLALVVVGLLIVWRSTLSRQQKLVIGLGAALVFGVLAGTAFWDRISTIWDPQTEYDRTAGGRTEVWKTGLTLMLTRPWGVGIDGFVTAEGLTHGGKGKWSAPHNTFLQIGADLGIAGLIVFVLMLKHTFMELRGIQQAARPPTNKRVVRRHGVPSAREPLPSGQPAPRPDAKALVELAASLQISLVGFAVGGFFLSQAYGPLPYLVVALSLVNARLAGRLPTRVQGLQTFRGGKVSSPYERRASHGSTAASPSGETA
jgi:putative inorganic carbon (HCO3(-)) transporter